MGLRVLLYAPVNPADRGGVQAVFNRLAEHLRRNGHLVSKAWGLPGTTAPPGEILCACAPLVLRRGLPAPRSALGAARALARCATHLLRLRPVVVNVHFVTPEAAAYFLFFRRVFRYKLVLSVHGSDVLRADASDVDRLTRILPRADRITAVSRVTATRVLEIAGISPCRVRVIPNGIDYAFWSAASDTRGRGAPVVLTVGRLDPVKGHDVLLRAFARLLDNLPDARLVVVGGGGGRGQLERLAGDLGIRASVEFTGELHAEGVRGRMRGADCFVLPSRSEGWPLAPLEAMAAGVPVVATRVGGVPEIVQPGTGLLVPPEDPVALAAALVSVLREGELAAGLSRRGRRRAQAFEAAVADAAYEEVLLGASTQP